MLLTPPSPPSTAMRCNGGFGRSAELITSPACSTVHGPGHDPPGWHNSQQGLTITLGEGTSADGFCLTRYGLPRSREWRWALLCTQSPLPPCPELPRWVPLHPGPTCGCQPSTLVPVALRRSRHLAPRQRASTTCSSPAAPRFLRPPSPLLAPVHSGLGRRRQPLFLPLPLPPARRPGFFTGRPSRPLGFSQLPTPTLVPVAWPRYHG